ncbi:Cation transporter family protein [Aphelenchoides bicaudatus]|nr:Cation transporter family protein [Aphelenchoides bicaudatus]
MIRIIGKTNYDIPQWIVPQAPTTPDRKTSYQRVEVHSAQPKLEEKPTASTTRHFANQQVVEEPSETSETNALPPENQPELFDYEATRDFEDTQSTKNVPDYIVPDNTIYPQATPGVTVDQFIKSDSIKVEINECLPDKKIIERLLQDYHTHKTPSEQGVKVFIEIWLQEITSVNERTSDFEAELYLSEIWMDNALNYEDFHPCRNNLTLSYEILDKIWKPNTVFINSKLALIHRSPFPNIFILIYSNGTVWINERLQVKGPCDMEFSSVITMFVQDAEKLICFFLYTFPMDTQSCLLTLESFNYHNGEVDMLWNEIEKPLLLLKDPIVLPDFLLSNYTTYLTKVQYPAGVWNELTMQFTFSRRFGWYALQAYFPTYMTIFISWISFCLGPKMIPARTMLGVNSLLALIFQFGNVMRNLPRVSYIKALDVWVLVCLLFVFASLIELAIVGIIANQAEKPIRIKAPSSMFSSVDDSENEPEKEENRPENAVSQTTPKDSGQWYSQEPKHVGQVIAPARDRHWLEMQESSHTDSVVVAIKSIFNQIKQSVKRKRKKILYVTTTQIDNFSLYCFPFCFAVFNLVYWAYYWSRDH